MKRCGLQSFRFVVVKGVIFRQLAEKARHACRIIAELPAPIAHEIEVNAIDVIVPYDIQIQPKRPVGGIGVAGIDFAYFIVIGIAERVCGEPFRMQLRDVITGVACARTDRARIDPCMNGDGRLHSMGMLDQAGQRVEVRGVVRSPGFIVRSIVSIASLAHLCEYGIAMGAVQTLQERVDLQRGLIAFIKAIRPESAQFPSLAISAGPDA